MATPGSENRITGERWSRIQELFYGASELPSAERSAYLRDCCGEDQTLRLQVESLLLASEEPDEVIEREVAGAAERVLAAAAAAQGKPEPAIAAGDRIGPHRIVRELGRGGMGTVYLAERADDEYHKLVAIKLARGGFASEESLRRFRIERQILARLEHPHIGRLLDGGSTAEGQPYVVMEYIDGKPVTAFCKETGAPLAQRLRLFLDICSAVECAHRSLVVHRDLKPGNILVTREGVAKLLDFGIAKLLADEQTGEEALTGPLERILTPEYASPEQVRGEPITTASDVYSLGVILYELLTGAAPYTFPSRTALDIERVVCQQEPERPSQRSGDRKLAGDLDNIVLMAMRKEPARRYASVAGLAADIRAYLEGYPVLACQEGWSYRAGKFVRRNALVVGLSTVMVLALAGFSIGMAVLAKRLVVERDSARAVSDFLVKIFERADTGQTKGESVTAREALDEGLALLDSDLQRQPQVQATLLSAIGRVYFNLGLHDRATAVIERGLKLRQQDPGTDELDLARSYKDLSDVWRQNHKQQGAVEAARKALEIRRRKLGEDHADVAEAWNTLGLAINEAGDPKNAEPMYRTALEIYRRTLGDDNEYTLVAMSNLGALLQARGDLKGAEPLLRGTLESRRRMYGELHWRTARSVRRLARLLEDLGRFPESEALFREAIELNGKLYGPMHNEYAQSVNGLASVFHDQRKYDEAEPRYREALAILEKIRPDTLDLATVINNLGTLEEERGKPDAAEELYRRSLEIRKRRLGADHVAVARAHHNLGKLLLNLKRFPEARKELTEAIRIRTLRFGAGGPDTGESKMVYAQAVLLDQGYPAARPLFTEAIEIIRKALPPENRRRKAIEAAYASVVARHEGKRVGTR